MAKTRNRRRSVGLSPEVHAFLDAWEQLGRLNCLHGTGHAPLSAFVERLIRSSDEFQLFQSHRLVPGEGRKQ